MKTWHDVSIKTQITIYYLFTAILIVILLGTALYYSTSRIIRDEVAKTTEMAIENGGHQLEMYIDQLKGLSSIITENNQVCRYFGQPHAYGKISDNSKTDIERMIVSILAENPEIASIILIGSDGKIVSNEKNLDMEFSGDIRKKDWYQNVLKSSMPILTSARMQEFSMDKNTWVVSLGREINDENGNHIGILRIDLKYDVIESILSNLNLGRSGYPFILNNDNEVVFHPDPAVFGNDEEKQRLIDILKMKSKELKQHSIITHRYDLTNAGWTMVGVASLDSVARMRNDIILVLWIVGFLMVVTAFGSGRLFAKNIAHPLRKLEKIMKRVEDGELDVAVSVDGSVEIKSLSRHFDSMIRQIKNLMSEVRKKEQYLHESKIRHLYNQINPHFLYNTMDTIVWLAEFGETEKVVSVSKAMARYFRLSLHGGSDITTVKDEIDHVRQYLFIQKERYQDKLKYEISVNQDILNINIPKLILQPIVENSINHGIRNNDGEGVVKISGLLENGILLLTVEDDGIGFDVAKIIEKSRKNKYDGVGLQNVEERIRLYYGKEYGIDIESTEGKGSRVTLRLGYTLEK